MAASERVPLPASVRIDRRAVTWNRYREGVLGFAGVVILLTCWQVSADLGLVRKSFTSSPIGALGGLREFVASGSIWPALGSTVATVLVGLGVAIVVGIPGGLLIGRNRILYGLTEPLIGVMYSVPFVVFLPLIIFWFGIDDQARTIIVIWAAFFPLIINVIAGARNIDRSLLQVTTVFCSSNTRTLRSVVFPATLPYILAGVRQAVSRALVGSVVAELFMGGEGLGFLVQQEIANFQMDRAMAAIFVIAVLAVALTRTVAWFERAFTFWSTSS